MRVTEDKEVKHLIKECQKGNESAYKVFYEKYYAFLLSVCRRYARDEEEAKDILHNGFIKIFKKLNQYKNTGSFKGWIKRIMINESINYFKRTNKGNLTSYYQDDYSLELHCNAVKEDVYDRFELEELMKLVQELPPAYRTVFSLYAIDGFSHKEIADKLNIKVSTSKSNLTRARAHLRIKLDAQKKTEQTKKELIYVKKSY